MKNAVLLSMLSLVYGMGCTHTTMSSQPAATINLEPRSGSSASGTVRLTQMDDGQVKVAVDLSGLTPGRHGFHVHEKGDCSAPDASSAGPHFNPGSAPHGAHGEGSHEGDFGNVTADSNGRARTEFMTRSVTVTEGPASIAGRAFLVHADPDDLTSQPAGNSGKRILCGVPTMMTSAMRP
ncbi:MAG TPA: superoxide dismutase family protein [Thermoanaerobaculia bacterium]|nr:superoxide dismutase family protein [Thermoanaerobaculia bacterium]